MRLTEIYKKFSRKWFKTNRRILIMDNNPDTLMIMQTALSDENYQVKVTSHISEFHSLIGNWRPGLVIVDIQLREGDGTELCRKLKTSEQTKHIGVIICSAYITENTDLSLFTCDAIIRKPFGLAELHAAVARCWNRK